MAQSGEQLAFGTRFAALWKELGTHPSDLHVVTFPKSGTTWMQMILWHLTTDGAVAFEHINDVSPWLRFCALTHAPLPVVHGPRIIKWHETYEDVPADALGRFIVVVRDGLDVIASFTHHKQGEDSPGATFDSLFDERIERWADHVSGWLGNEGGRRVHVVRYEDLLTDVESEMDRLIAFLGLSVRAETKALAIERTRLDTMRRHDHRFGPPNRRARHAFIRNGTTGEGRRLASDAQKQRYDALSSGHFAVLDEVVVSDGSLRAMDAVD